MSMQKTDSIFVAGARGMVGGAICRALDKNGYHNVLAPNRDALDLGDQAAVSSWFAEHKPDHVFLAAAKVGGIHANNAYPGRIHPRQPGDRDQCHSLGLEARDEENCASWARRASTRSTRRSR